MGCNSSAYVQAQKDLHALKQLQILNRETRKELGEMKAQQSFKITKMQEDQFAEIKELHVRIATMVEATSEERRKLEEKHTEELTQMQEQHTGEVRRLQQQHTQHMSAELKRHMEEVRRLQGEYYGQLKSMGGDMRTTAVSIANARHWGPWGMLCAPQMNNSGLRDIVDVKA
mmetsp:Transcript_49472/g.105758  ORF Transcript_49472/g.105758 Transcript_49472/m.105758 type:complete len:172 (+) Transcript_49472:104-619(+)